MSDRDLDYKVTRAFWVDRAEYTVGKEFNGRELSAGDFKVVLQLGLIEPLEVLSTDVSSDEDIEDEDIEEELEDG